MQDELRKELLGAHVSLEDFAAAIRRSAWKYPELSDMLLFGEDSASNAPTPEQMRLQLVTATSFNSKAVRRLVGKLVPTDAMTRPSSRYIECVLTRVI